MIKSFMNKLREKMEVAGAFRVNKAGMFIVVVFLTVLVFAASGCTGGGNSDISANVPAPEAPAPGTAADTGNADPAAVDAAPNPGGGVDAGGGIDVEAGSAQDKSNNKKPKRENVEAAEDDVDVIAADNDKMVLVTVEDTGRVDPFLPYNEAKKEEENKNTLDLEKAKLEFDLVDPPKAAASSPEADKILTTKVSGIIYDSESPSAILNIEGSDYLVRSGDVVNGYKVLSIQPTVVTVQLGANVYQAGVGQLLVTDGIQYNTISNLENKFGGSKNK